MGGIYKKITSNDVSRIRSVLHEYVPIEAGHVWQSVDFPDNNNIKNVVTGMFQQVYDTNIAYSSANKLFDITLGVESSSDIFTSSYGYNSNYDIFGVGKRNIYKSLSLRLLGAGANGTTILFDEDGDFYSVTGGKYKEFIALSLSRLVYKDGIKKGSFKLSLAMNPYGFYSDGTHKPDDYFAWDGSTPSMSILEIRDENAETNYRKNSLVGDFAVLYAFQPSESPILAQPDVTGKQAVGLIFYNVGIVLLNPFLFAYKTSPTSPGLIKNFSTPSFFQMLYNCLSPYNNDPPLGLYSIVDLMRGHTDGGTPVCRDISIKDLADAFRTRIYSIQLQNTVELNSTIYFCRLNHNEFNYSSNPTYLNGSRIRVKNASIDAPVSYITGVGLYSEDGELLAVAKLSEPLRKSTDVDLTLRVRLDY